MDVGKIEESKDRDVREPERDHDSQQETEALAQVPTGVPSDSDRGDGQVPGQNEPQTADEPAHTTHLLPLVSILLKHDIVLDGRASRTDSDASSPAGPRPRVMVVEEVP
jgi:hypothetical protein